MNASPLPRLQLARALCPCELSGPLLRCLLAYVYTWAPAGSLTRLSPHLHLLPACRCVAGVLRGAQV
jgi:hypothetical protein